MMEQSNCVEGIHYQSGNPIRVYIAGGVIDTIKMLTNTEKKKLDSIPFIGPGLVDLQINGFSGIDFNSPLINKEDVQTITKKLWAEGVTTYYPTVITNSDEAIEKMLSSISQACNMDYLIGSSIAGIHLEGPFISPEDGPRGAHAKEFVKAPDWELFERWQQAADGLIKIITLSPEWEEAPEFISRCVRSGVVVSIGHTAASAVQIQKAVQSGATLSTHLGNGAHLNLPRHPNYIWEQLAQAPLSACVIADGYHLPESVLKVFQKVKAEQLFLVSDAVYLSGMEPGVYDTHIGGRVVLTAEGRLHLADHPGLLAGSAKMLKTGVEHLVQSHICPLAAAWDMASVNPAVFMNLEVRKGLVKGASADIITFNWENGAEDKLQLKNVYKNGHQVIASNDSNACSQV